MTTEHPAARLIRDLAASGRAATTTELALIREHVAQAEFDPAPIARIGGRGAGLVWGGRILRGRDRLPSAEVHYLRHVVAQQEWPPGTTLAAYLDSVREIVLDPSSGIFLSRYEDQQQAGWMRRSGEWRGPDGADWILVEYRSDVGFLMTAHQIEWAALDAGRRTDLRWLKLPG